MMVLLTVVRRGSNQAGVARSRGFSIIARASAFGLYRCSKQHRSRATLWHVAHAVREKKKLSSEKNTQSNETSLKQHNVEAKSVCIQMLIVSDDF